MHFSPDFERVSKRISQITFSIFLLLGVATMIALGVASVQFAHMRDRLAPRIRQELSQMLGRDVHIGAVHVNWLDQVVIANTTVARGATFADGTAFTAPQMTARLDLLGLALHHGANPVAFIDQLTITHPYLSVNRSQQGRWDFQDIVERLREKANTPAWHGQLVVDDGAVAYHDAHGFGYGSLPIQQEVVDIDGSMLPHGTQGYAFEMAAADAGHQMGRVRLKGLYSTGADNTRVDVDANRVAVNAFAQYLPKNLPITFTNGTAAFRLSALIRNLPKPEDAHQLTGPDLTAEVDLTGIGLHLREMSAPIMATSGQLRLVHDGSRYPDGSRLELINVHARAASLPVDINGTINDINLFDLAHVHPRFNVAVRSDVQDGSIISRLFPNTRWLQKLQLGGGVTLKATIQGRPGQLQVDGKIHSDYVTLPNFQANDVIGAFNLRPGADGTQQTPTVRVALHADQALLSDNKVSNIAFLATSNTGWKELAVNPQITGAISAMQLQAPWGDIAQIWGTYHVDRTGVKLNTLKGVMFGGQIAGAAQIPFKTTNAVPSNLLTATGNYSGVDLAQLARRLKNRNIAGIGQGTLSLIVTPDGKVRIDTALNGSKLRIQQYQADALNLHVHIQDKDGVVHADIPHATAQAKYGSFTVDQGSFDYNPRLSSQSRIRLPLHGEKMPLENYGYDPLTGLATLDGVLEGNLSTPVLHAQVAVNSGSLYAHSFTDAHSDVTVQVNAQGNLDKLLLRNLGFTHNGMKLTVPGGNGFDPRRGLMGIPATLQVHGTALNDLLGLFQQQTPWPIDGSTDATLNLQMTEDGLSVVGSAAMTKPVIHLPLASGAYALPLDRLMINFSMLGRQMLINDLQIDRGETTLHAQGKAESFIGSPLYARITFRGTHARLEDFPQDLLGIPLPLNGPAEVNGNLEGMLTGTGPTPLTVKVSTQTADLHAAGVSLGTGAVDLTYRYRPEDRDLTIEDGAVNNAAFHAESVGHYRLDHRQMDGVRFTLDRMNLSTLQGLLAHGGAAMHSLPALARFSDIPHALAGQGQMQVYAEGNFSQPTLRMGFGLTQLALDAKPLPDVRGSLSSLIRANHYGLHIDEIIAEAQHGHAQFSGDIAQDGALQLQIAAHQFPVNILSPWVKQLPVAGNVDIQGTISGPWKTPIVEADVSLAHPAVNGHTLGKMAGHLHEDARNLLLSHGAVWLADDTQPISVRAALPLGWENLRQPAAANTRPISLAMSFPQQDLSLFTAFMPALPGANGTLAGNLQIGGTLAHPRLLDGHVAMLGSAAFPLSNSAFAADRLQNIDLRADITNDGQQSHVTITRFLAMLVNQNQFDAAANAQPGWLISNGAIGIPNDALSAPMRWHWDVYGRVVRMPFTPDLFPVPQASALFHLTESANSPLLTGVALLENAKIKQPNLPENTSTGWGELTFNPRLSIVLQVGDGVKLAKGFFNFPLLKTPLPRVDISDLPSGTLPAPDQQHTLTGYNWNATMLHPGGNSELPGTWGVITGSLGDPRLYARFEVDKNKLTFPLNLLASARNARGRITYSLAEGAHLTMGIPNRPVTEAAKPGTVLGPGAQVAQVNR